MTHESWDIERLIADALEDCRDGALDDQRLQEIRQLLLTNPTARQLYLKHTRFSRMLAAKPLPQLASKEAVDAATNTGSGNIAPPCTTTREETSGELSTISVRSAPTGHRIMRGMAGWITAAVALIVLASVVFQHNTQQGDDTHSVSVASSDQEETTDPGVAVLTRVSELRGEKSADWATGATIPPGTLSWDAGLLQLEFYCGATVVVEGPARLEILDDSCVICRSGRLRAHVPREARGFTVLAPTVELVDLGTEFGMNVSIDGATEVHVFDGAVELYAPDSNRDASTLRELKSGDAVALDSNGMSESIEVRDGDFVTPMRLSAMMKSRRHEQLRQWAAFRDSLEDDPRVIAFFPFDRNDLDDRLLLGQGVDGCTIEGAIVGCEWTEGRWPGKTSLQFKRPGDRVRVTVPGEFESLTYSAWLRLDGLDRTQNSLLLTDGFGIGSPHWQIRMDGRLILGMRYSEEFSYPYQTDEIFNLFRLGQWVHLATVYDADQACVKHYVNGELAKREPLKQSAAVLLKIGKATIGNWGVPSLRHRNSRVRNLNGCMDELIVFGQALDDVEIRRIYEVGRP